MTYGQNACSWDALIIFNMVELCHAFFSLPACMFPVFVNEIGIYEPLPLIIMMFLETLWHFNVEAKLRILVNIGC